MLTGILSAASLKGVPLSWPVISTALGNGYFFVISATLLAIFLAGVCLLVKYIPQMFDDLKNATNNEMPESGLKLWIAFVLLIPFFLDAGPMWFALWWFILLWGYLIRTEKRIAFFFVFMIFMSGWIAHIGAGFLTYSQTQLNREIFASEKKIGTDRDGLAIASWIKTHPADAEPMNAMALVEIDRANYPEAIRLLDRSIDLEPANPRFYNHLGIALVGSGKKKEATKAFQYASELMPENMLYYFNLSRLQQSTYNFYEAERSIATASGLDPDGIRRLLDAENTQGRSRYIEEHMPVLRQLGRQMKPSDDLKIAADALWTMAFGMIPRKMSIFLAIGIFLIFFFQGYIPEDKFSKRCSRCGKLYYSGTTTKAGNPMCLQCHWIEAKVKKQQTSILHHKTEEIRKYKAFNYQRLARLELILPGLGSFLINRTGLGLARISILSIAVLLIITGGSFITSFIPTDTGLSAFFRILGLLVLGVLFLRAYKVPPVRYGV